MDFSPPIGTLLQYAYHTAVSMVAFRDELAKPCVGKKICKAATSRPEFMGQSKLFPCTSRIHPGEQVNGRNRFPRCELRARGGKATMLRHGSITG